METEQEYCPYCGEDADFKKTDELNNRWYFCSDCVENFGLTENGEYIYV